MYDEEYYECNEHQSEEIFAQPRQAFNDHTATRETSPSNCDSLVVNASPDLPLELESSIVYETPLWDSQQHNLLCDNVELNDIQSDSAQAHKKRKLM